MFTVKKVAQVGKDGTLTLTDLPLEEGVRVEVTITVPPQAINADGRYPLHGTVYRYDDPFEPAVDPDEWEALQ